jgi:hypothetical protein
VDVHSLPWLGEGGPVAFGKRLHSDSHGRCGFLKKLICRRATMSMLLQSTFPRMALTVQTSSKPETRRIRTLGVRAEAGDAVVEGEGTAGVGVAVTTQTRTSRARGSVLLPQSRLQALAFGQSAIKTPSATRGCAVSSHGASNPLVSVRSRPFSIPPLLLPLFPTTPAICFDGGDATEAWVYR